MNYAAWMRSRGILVTAAFLVASGTQPRDPVHARDHSVPGLRSPSKGEHAGRAVSPSPDEFGAFAEGVGPADWRRPRHVGEVGAGETGAPGGVCETGGGLSRICGRRVRGGRQDNLRLASRSVDAPSQSLLRCLSFESRDLRNGDQLISRTDRRFEIYSGHACGLRKSPQFDYARLSRPSLVLLGFRDRHRVDGVVSDHASSSRLATDSAIF